MDSLSRVMQKCGGCVVLSDSASVSAGVESAAWLHADWALSQVPSEPVPLGHNRPRSTHPRPLLSSLRRVYAPRPHLDSSLRDADKTSANDFYSTPPAAPVALPTHAPAVPAAPQAPHPEPETKRVDPASGRDHAPNPRDRRAHPRRESGCQVAVCARSSQTNLTPQHIEWALHAAELKGRLIDVSMSGLAMELAEPIEAQTRVYMRISNRNLDRKIDTCAKILRCVANGSGQWNIVCRLEKNLSFEQLHFLGKHLFASTIV